MDLKTCAVRELSWFVKWYEADARTCARGRHLVFNCVQQLLVQCVMDEAMRECVNACNWTASSNTFVQGSFTAVCDVHPCFQNVAGTLLLANNPLNCCLT